MKSKEEPLAQISAAEWQIMECLWANGPMYMADIVAELKDHHEWSRTTVLTLASRLEKKGFIGTERSSKAYLYVPVIPRKTALTERLQAFVEETFAGNYYSLAKVIAESAKLSVEEEKKLRARFKAAKESPAEPIIAAQVVTAEEPLAQRKLGSSEATEKIKEKVKAKTKNKDKEKIESGKGKKGGKKAKKK